MSTGLPVDITASTTTVYAKLRAKGTTTVLQTITCTKVFPSVGWFRLDWPADTWDVDAGRYEVEVYVDFDSDIQTVNQHSWVADTSDTAKELQIKVEDDF